MSSGPPRAGPTRPTQNRPHRTTVVIRTRMAGLTEIESSRKSTWRAGGLSETHDGDRSVIRALTEFIHHPILTAIDGTTTRSGTDDGKCDRLELLFGGDLQRVTNGIANRPFGGSPEEIDPRDVDDAFEGQSPGTCQHSPTQRDHWHLAQFSKGLNPRSCLDRPRDALRYQQPPGEKVTIPGVDDDIDVLIEQVTGDD